MPGGTSLRRIARNLDVEVRVIQNLNPHLVQGVTPLHEIFPVRVLVGTAPLVLASGS